MTALKLDDQVVETSVGDETVLLHLTTGIYFGLDATGTFIWSRIKQGQSIVSICDAVVAAFDVSSEQAEADVATFIDELRDNGIIADGTAASD